MTKLIQNIFSAVANNSGIYLSKWKKWEEKQVERNKILNERRKKRRAEREIKWREHVEKHQIYPFFGPTYIAYNLTGIVVCIGLLWMAVRDSNSNPIQKRYVITSFISFLCTE